MAAQIRGQDLDLPFMTEERQQDEADAILA
jgi:hypothetical protein